MDDVKNCNLMATVLPEILNKKEPNFCKPQKAYIKAILKSQTTYFKGLPKFRNIYIKPLKIMPKTWFL